MLAYTLDHILEKGDPDIQSGIAVFYVKALDLPIFYAIKLTINPFTEDLESKDYVVTNAGLKYLEMGAIDMFSFGEVNSPAEAKAIIELAGLEYIERFLDITSKASLYQRMCLVSIQDAINCFNDLHSGYAMSLYDQDYDRASALYRDMKLFRNFFPRNEDNIPICDYRN